MSSPITPSPIAFEMVYFGLSASNSQRLYTYSEKRRLFLASLIDLSKEILRDAHFRRSARLEFRFRPRGYDLRRFYLPPHFDATKKYPMIVNYYGGTTPTAPGDGKPLSFACIRRLRVHRRHHTTQWSDWVRSRVLRTPCQRMG